MLTIPVVSAAFDKTDLLYLRYVVESAMQLYMLDFSSLLSRVIMCPDTSMHVPCRDQEEKSRHTEIELHDREVQQYAQLRMKTDKQRPGGGPAAGSLGVAKKIDKDKSRCLEEHCALSVVPTKVLDVCQMHQAVCGRDSRCDAGCRPKCCSESSRSPRRQAHLLRRGRVLRQRHGQGAHMQRRQRRAPALTTQRALGTCWGRTAATQMMETSSVKLMHNLPKTAQPPPVRQLLAGGYLPLQRQ